MKRDCLFLLADSNMQAAFEGFLSRDQFYRSLGCGQFDFDARLDIFVAAGDNDPGLFTRGHELLRPYQNTHHRAIVVLDAEWEGAPKAKTIQQQMTARIEKTDWQMDTFKVIVIDPELENWIWQKNDHVAQGLGYSDIAALLAEYSVQQAWPKGQAKPVDPKGTLEAVLRNKRIPRSSAIYKKITSKVSVRNCGDESFMEMANTLKIWFPVEEIM